MALTAYLTAVQNLLGTGGAGNLYNTGTLTTYINTARNQIAAEGECVRAIPPISGPITTITVTSGGSGYGNVTAVIVAPDSPPGFGAFPGGQQASATIVTGAAGTITAVNLLSTGGGYFAPTTTLSQAATGGGTGAVITTIVSGICQTTVNREVYPYSQFNPMVATSGSGINSIFRINSISMIWGSLRWTLAHVSFGKYQALVRNYTAYQDVPGVFANFAQGDSGSVYVYPVPNSSYQMEWDAICFPNALATDTDVEAIPKLWQDAVPFLAAYYAFNQAQRASDADRMYKEYERWMHRARQLSTPRSVNNWYGRAI